MKRQLVFASSVALALAAGTTSFATMADAAVVRHHGGGHAMGPFRGRHFGGGHRYAFHRGHGRHWAGGGWRGGYYGGYYGGPYYAPAYGYAYGGPSVAFNFSSGGHWHHWH